MGGFSIANKLLNLFIRRSKVERKNTEVLRIKLNGEVEYYVRRKAVTAQLSTLATRSNDVRQCDRIGSVVMFCVDRPNTVATFELCLVLPKFGAEYGLLLTNSQIIAQRELNSKAMLILNGFVPYLEEQGWVVFCTLLFQMMLTSLFVSVQQRERL